MNYVRATTFGSFVRSAFGLYFGNFAVLCGIYLLPNIPAGLFADLILPTEGLFYAAASYVSTFAILIASAAMTLAVSEICLGNRPAVIDTYRRLTTRAGSVIWTALLVALIFEAGNMMLVTTESRIEGGAPPDEFFLIMFIAITYLAVLGTYLMFAMSVAALEKAEAVDALKRSFRLVRGFFWRNLGVALVTCVLLLVAIFILTVGQISLNGLESIDESPSALESLIDHLVLGITIVPSYVAIVLLYYDSRVRKEQFDHEQLAQELPQ